MRIIVHKDREIAIYETMEPFKVLHHIVAVVVCAREFPGLAFVPNSYDETASFTRKILGGHEFPWRGQLHRSGTG